MAKNNPDISWQPKLKGDRGKLRDRDKYREKFEDIRKDCGCKFGEKCFCTKGSGEISMGALKEINAKLDSSACRSTMVAYDGEILHRVERPWLWDRKQR